MTRENYELWKSWHNGSITRILTSNEETELNNCELMMNYLIPNSKFLRQINKFGSLEEVKDSEYAIKYIADFFDVETDVIKIKLEYFIKIDKEINVKMLKKEHPTN